MRSQRRALLLLVTAFTLAACSGGSDGSDNADVTAQLTTAPTSPSSSSALASTRVVPSTTVGPSSPTFSTEATTTPATRPVVMLPPGVTEADRIAVEEAAIGWWEEFYRQLLALPNFDPQAILERTMPGRPAGPEMLSTLEERKAKKFRFEPGRIHQTVLLDTRFLSPNLVEVQVCLADDGVFVQEDSGREELGGLGRVFYLAVLSRDISGWKVDDFGSFRQSEDGRTCR